MKRTLITLLIIAVALAPLNAMAEAEITVTIVSTDGVETESATAVAPEPTQETARQAETLSPITPAQNSPSPRQDENSYWCTPMDIRDEEAVWNMLMAPITVVNLDQKKQVQLRKEPSEDSEAVADITGYSQGVHVLETLDNGWTLVEAYSSSFHDSEVKAWNQFTQGYIKTSLLQVKEVGNREYAIVVDKLTQRMYIFKDGKVFAELLVSTGLVNERQPYNETRSGEFLLVSAVGQFVSDNLLCNYAMRFNSGDLIHEVPHVDNADGTPNYRNTEPKLGERASHGCIRVQRLRNPDGVNMRWIWNELYKSIAKNPVKLVIWEDLPGRRIPLPDADTPLYYNANGGKNYHASATCFGVKDEYLPMTQFTYAQLEDAEHASLTPCPYCSPPHRQAEYEAINAAHSVQ